VCVLRSDEDASLSRKFETLSRWLCAS